MTEYADRQEYAKRSISNYLNAIRLDTAFDIDVVKHEKRVKKQAGVRVHLSRLKAIRVEKGLSQHKLSAMSNVGHCSINEYELGLSRAKMEKAEKIARALKCKVEDLV